jgi:hypothetical protein
MPIAGLSSLWRAPRCIIGYALLCCTSFGMLSSSQWRALQSHQLIVFFSIPLPGASMPCPIMSIGREIPQQQEKTPHSAEENEFGHVPSMKMVVAGLAQCDSFSLRLRALHWRLTSGGYHRSRLPNVKCWRSPLLAKFVKQMIQATSAFVPIIIGP